jgi:hypothetical protein
MHGPGRQFVLLLSPLHLMQTMVWCVSRALSTDERDVHLLDCSGTRTTTQSHTCKRPHLMTSALLFGRAQSLCFLVFKRPVLELISLDQMHLAI